MLGGEVVASATLVIFEGEVKRGKGEVESILIKTHYAKWRMG
jgi:hypothetical protein